MEGKMIAYIALGVVLVVCLGLVVWYINSVVRKIP